MDNRPIGVFDSKSLLFINLLKGIYIVGNKLLIRITEHITDNVI